MFPVLLGVVAASVVAVAVGRGHARGTQSELVEWAEPTSAYDRFVRGEDGEASPRAD